MGPHPKKTPDSAGVWNLARGVTTFGQPPIATATVRERRSARRGTTQPITGAVTTTPAPATPRRPRSIQLPSKSALSIIIVFPVRLHAAQGDATLHRRVAQSRLGDGNSTFPGGATRNAARYRLDPRRRARLSMKRWAPKLGSACSPADWPAPAPARAAARAAPRGPRDASGWPTCATARARRPPGVERFPRDQGTAAGPHVRPAAGSRAR